MEYKSPWVKVTGLIQVSDVNDNNFISLPDPSKLKANTYDLDSDGSGRNLDGDMQRDRVAVKEKLELTFPPLLADDYHKVLEAISPQFFKCKFFSLSTGNVRTAIMYAGDRSAESYYEKENQSSDLWTDLTVNFIEK